MGPTSFFPAKWQPELISPVTLSAYFSLGHLGQALPSGPVLRLQGKSVWACVGVCVHACHLKVPSQAPYSMALALSTQHQSVLPMTHTHANVSQSLHQTLLLLHPRTPGHKRARVPPRLRLSSTVPHTTNNFLFQQLGVQN